MKKICFISLIILFSFINTARAESIKLYYAGIAFIGDAAKVKDNYYYSNNLLQKKEPKKDAKEKDSVSGLI